MPIDTWGWSIWRLGARRRGGGPAGGTAGRAMAWQAAKRSWARGKLRRGQLRVARGKPGAELAKTGVVSPSLGAGIRAP